MYFISEYLNVFAPSPPAQWRIDDGNIIPRMITATTRVVGEIVKGFID